MEDHSAPAGKGLSALVYTQLTDVEDEVNGLFTYDHTPSNPTPPPPAPPPKPLEAGSEKELKKKKKNGVICICACRGF